MNDKTPEEKFLLINVLCQQLSSLVGDIKLTIKGNSICIGRTRLDKATNRETLMVSCIKEANFFQKTFYIFLIEQHNKNNSYDKDSKRGSHIHNFINSKKVNTHIPFSGSIKDVAIDIIKTMDNNL